MKISFFIFLVILFNTHVVSAQPGTLDSSFSKDGKLLTAVGIRNAQANSVAIQSAGRIITGGFSHNGSNFDFSLVRYTRKGKLDTSFGVNGKTVSDFGNDEKGYSLALQKDSKILMGGISGDDFALARYTESGNLDSTFGMQGHIFTDFGGDDHLSTIALSPDGRILAAGSSSGDFVLAKYKQNGKPESSFGVKGKVYTDFGSLSDNCESMVLKTDGKILLSGYFFNGLNNDFVLSQYNADGTLDTSFGNKGKVITDLGGNDKAHSLATQQDGKLLVGGFYAAEEFDFNIAVVRYKINGEIDSSFAENGKVIFHAGTYGEERSTLVQPDGKIITAGNADGNFFMIRLVQNGEIDSIFGTNGFVITDFQDQDKANAAALQKDGKIILAGTSQGKFAVARYFGNDDSPLEQERKNISNRKLDSKILLIRNDVK